MSVRHPDGSAVEPQGDPAAFLLQLHRGWAGSDETRLRKLAAVTLHANGWTMDMIAKAMGWQARGHVARVIQATKVEICQYFADRNPDAKLPISRTDDNPATYHLNA